MEEKKDQAFPCSLEKKKLNYSIFPHRVYNTAYIIKDFFFPLLLLPSFDMYFTCLFLPFCEASLGTSFRELYFTCF